MKHEGRGAPPPPGVVKNIAAVIVAGSVAAGSENAVGNENAAGSENAVGVGSEGKQAQGGVAGAGRMGGGSARIGMGGEGAAGAGIGVGDEECTDGGNVLSLCWLWCVCVSTGGGGQLRAGCRLVLLMPLFRVLLGIVGVDTLCIHSKDASATLPIVETIKIPNPSPISKPPTPVCAHPPLHACGWPSAAPTAIAPTRLPAVCGTPVTPVSPPADSASPLWAPMGPPSHCCGTAPSRAQWWHRQLLCTCMVCVVCMVMAGVVCIVTVCMVMVGVVLVGVVGHATVMVSTILAQVS